MIDNSGDAAATEVCPGCFGTGVKIVEGPIRVGDRDWYRVDENGWVVGDFLE